MNFPLQLHGDVYVRSIVGSRTCVQWIIACKKYNKTITANAIDTRLTCTSEI